MPSIFRYAITDTARSLQDASARRDALRAQLQRWSAAGIDFVQLREKSLAAGELFELACILAEELRKTASHTRLLINARADIAAAAGAHGVHLTASPGELTPAQVRSLFATAGRDRPLITVSCHTVAEAARAHLEGAGLILFGPVFEKVAGTEPALEGSGLGLLREAVHASSPTPVLALGGITSERIPACLQAGAAGIAAIRLFGSGPLP